MSELKQTIRADLKTAMKAKEKQRTSAIRALLAAIQAEETNGSRHELEDADILKVIAREIKKRRESAEVYEDNGRPELAEAELADVPFLRTALFFPRRSTLVSPVVARWPAPERSVEPSCCDERP